MPSIYTWTMRPLGVGVLRFLSVFRFVSPTLLSHILHLDYAAPRGRSTQVAFTIEIALTLGLHLKQRINFRVCIDNAILL